MLVVVFQHADVNAEILGGFENYFVVEERHSGHFGKPFGYFAPAASECTVNSYGFQF